MFVIATIEYYHYYYHCQGPHGLRPEAEAHLRRRARQGAPTIIVIVIVI